MKVKKKIPDVKLIVGGEGKLLNYNKREVNVKGLANAIIELLQAKKIAKEKGRNGRRLVEEDYSWERVTKLIENVYQSICGGI